MKKFILSAILLTASVYGFACTNLIVTRGASADGSVMVTDAADSFTRYGCLAFIPAANHRKGEMRPVIQWGSDSKGAFRLNGYVPEVPHTYNVVGNMNEYQVVVGETTWNGVDVKHDEADIVDYGSAMWIAIQRSRTAREAIETIARITDEYGYSSTGESISVADPNEAWIMEVFPRKPKYVDGVNVNKGLVYVAIRIPDGHICAHANCARITTFPKDDPENCLYSPDVVQNARDLGLYEGSDEDFSFTDAYCPLTYSMLRACELRVWSFFNRFGAVDMNQYLDFVTAEDPTHRMPLSVPVKQKISVLDLAEMMRDHYEGTPFDMREGIAAGPSAIPYRWREANFEVDSVKYRHERPIAVQQTGFWFVSQSRGWLPDEVGGVLWFAVDDAGTAPLTPVYTCSTKISQHYAFGNGSMVEYSPTSMFWLVNRVAHFAYYRYDPVGVEVRDVIRRHEADMVEKVAEMDREAVVLCARSPRKAVKKLTDFSVKEADALFDKWESLDKYLLIKYMDGATKRQLPDGTFETHSHSNWVPLSPRSGDSKETYRRAIISETGDFFAVKKVK